MFCSLFISCLCISCLFIAQKYKHTINCRVCQWRNVYLILFITELMEMIHKAAFRDTLGHSLYMPGNRIGSFTPENVNRFASFDSS